MDAQGQKYKNVTVSQAFRAVHNGECTDTLPLIWCWPSNKVLDLLRTSEGGVSRLPIIHEGKMLEQCGDFGFAVELITEFLQDQAQPATKSIYKSIKENDHKEFMHHSHSIKGVARNLYLTGLSTVATEMDSIGKILIAHTKATAEETACTCDGCKHQFKIQDLLRDREPLLKEMLVEIDRLAKHLPELTKKAQTEEEDEEDPMDDE
eukprot:gb/GEZN01008020.1/.p1 GENE.gb/GEZN01008020.1/~~gb/GEZN01008020.1/.p1  ORF type:complete len:207 (+),score=22.55 gb/GEZN01008020.1/:332-952(+)